MEEGSLLREALQRRNHGQPAAAGVGGEAPLENSLLLDVYLLQHQQQQQQSCDDDDDVDSEASAVAAADHLVALADLAVELNACFQRRQKQPQSQYPWMSGGDGPVFGIHCSSSSSGGGGRNNKGRTTMIAHLRAICRYGASVADEWKAIGMLLELSRDRADIAVECWDVDDGQVLLIEAAEHLPAWVDRIGPEMCRHRCWIQAGRVRFIQPNDGDDGDALLTLGSALDLLRSKSPLAVITAPDTVQRAIQSAIERVDASSSYHRAAVAVPRSVARLLSNRPDLVATACRMFVEQSSVHSNTAKTQLENYLAGTCEDWVWTTVKFGRTAYAMLRTVTAAPTWTTEDSIPASLGASVEVKRLKRQCKVEATPHLKHGLQLGVRLVAGIDDCLSPMCQQPGSSAPPMSVTERRVMVHWSRIARELHSSNDWIERAWQAGPNDAQHSLESIVKCPVYDPEVESSLTPLSHPDADLSQQIRRELLRVRNEDDSFGSIPQPADVDDEDWMWMPANDEDFLPRDNKASPQQTSPTEQSSAKAPTTAALDEMLGGMQCFMAGESSVEGVASSERDGRIQINPTVFLNILHTALQSKSVEELSARLRAARTSHEVDDDPFFSREDYDLMEPDENDSDGEGDGDDDGDERGDVNMKDLMNAMDDELRASASASRGLDGEFADDQKVAQNAHVLSNLLKSLDVGGGGPGPIKNMLSEMGMKAPDLHSDNED